MSIQYIDAETLKAYLDSGEIVSLVMTMPPHAYAQAHIPGSLAFASPAEAEAQLRIQSPETLIVLYCTTAECQASTQVYQQLHAQGITNVAVLQGGLMAWVGAGFAVDGSKESAK